MSRRAHRATGGKRGGARAGAGRKPKAPIEINRPPREQKKPRAAGFSGGSRPDQKRVRSAAELAHIKESYSKFKPGDNARVAEFRKARGYKRAGAHRRQGREYVLTVARYLEFGTSKMTAKPFMTQAFESTKAQLEETITAGLKRSLGL